jgi:hypothetical protein
MKHWLTALCVAGVVGIAGPPVHSQDAIPSYPPDSIRVDVQMVSIPVAEAGRLIPSFMDRKTVNDAWNRLQAMITDGKATLMAWPIVWTHSGQRVVIESITEHRDSTVPMPPSPPQTFEPTISPSEEFTWGPFYVPGAFETRNAGASLEVEAIAEQDGKVIDLSIVPQYVQRIATREWRSQWLPYLVGVQQQPEFRTSKVTTYLKVRNNEPTLIATFVVAEPQPHVELFIVHAKATMLPAGAFLPPPAK